MKIGGAVLFGGCFLLILFLRYGLSGGYDPLFKSKDASSGRKVVGAALLMINTGRWSFELT